MFKIIRREEMADGTVILNEIEAPLIARKAKPGQFVIIKATEDGERIPLTMADADAQAALGEAERAVYLAQEAEAVRLPFGVLGAGLLAMAPFLHWRTRDLWQLHMLGKGKRRRPPR